MKLNPNAPTFVPSWGAPAPPAPTESKAFYEDYGSFDDPNAYGDETYGDYEAPDEINELLAEIERMQIEADLTRELETLKAQGRNEEADLWNKWMLGAPADFDQESTPSFPPHPSSNGHYKKPSHHHQRNHITGNSPRHSPRNHANSPQRNYHHQQPRAIYQPRTVNYN
ncbi:Aste57867_25544 [Aphanomyces stellatus]|uniref:Aste57867_25544 protein n=1 Tax=Aphanomyces stellatus TaxID=120398 RepID=A0A485LTC8_9STRA|nr:hypothetical protein As57867_025465 [Aphanomyces stellatus]VFU02167.1 Aste57867_25544 [Aphanomyces stellatus]